MGQTTSFRVLPKGTRPVSSCQKSGSSASMAPIGAGTPLKNFVFATKAVCKV
eukprot:CAMPEP_0197681862 /NCGR_PEP_ID=MMETSP1338-20131121/95592_1 /TAXON_ID=43686 ORGANISM="Pelagodinium beii, Strain RCC1491" /NCGR_SAMPLE_ID=MMETSP1338 /ASSEMBLY_ACC=CAM_ASM_000754 /LENGTH=51 /DNA_ID=CAMNT_0043263259 /DNA_START=8 /DNA_END=163 /DNA_ORIENTATION=+